MPATALPNYVGTFGVRGLGNVLRIDSDGRGLTMQRFGDDGSLDPNAYGVQFYAPDSVSLVGGAEDGNLLDFLRSDDGRLSWIRSNGRVFERAE
jgi:hypothetical protein